MKARFICRPAAPARCSPRHPCPPATAVGVSSHLFLSTHLSFTPDHAEPPVVRPGTLEVSQAAVAHPRQRFARFKSQTRVAKVKGRVPLVMDARASVLSLFSGGRPGPRSPSEAAVFLGLGGGSPHVCSHGNARLGAAGLTALLCAAGPPGLTAGASTCREDSPCWTSGTSSPRASTS